MPITTGLVERLLWEDESNTLDFKEAQYPFAGATGEQKAEIIKDILTFANAFRRDDAYILLGVRDVQGGRGIGPHLGHTFVFRSIANALCSYCGRSSLKKRVCA